MWATRNRVAHGYTTVDIPTMRNTITNDLPKPLATIEDALQSAKPSEPHETPETPKAGTPE